MDKENSLDIASWICWIVGIGMMIGSGANGLLILGVIIVIIGAELSCGASRARQLKKIWDELEKLKKRAQRI